MRVAAFTAMRIPISCVALTLVSSLASAQQQPAPPPPDVVSSSAGNLRVERLATLESPWGIALLPDGRVLVTEKAGRLRIFGNGQLSAPVTGVPAVVSRPTQFEQGGLLDVAVDPAFASNGYIYISYSEAAPQPSTDATETGELRFGDFVDMTDNIIRGGAVARARLVGNALQDVQVIWRQVPKTVGRGHFGNRLVFGPDGKLYITSGDRMRFDPAQQLSSSLGKVLRINSDGSIPADNPFASRQNARGDIYSYGHRNMLAATFDATGRLWVIEMGPLGGDELNLIQPGKNYGWPQVSNGDNYAGPSIPDHPTKQEYQEPVRTWTPVVSASGALLYTGAMYPAWRNSIIAGGLSSMSIIRLVIEGERVAHEERIWMGRRIRDVLQMPDGALLVIVDDKQKGDLLRLAPAR
jgi:glucose/arabinose dehydrogenase